MKNASQVKKQLKFYLSGNNLQIIPALVGLTGIGKTAIVKSVAKELGYELIYFNMAQLSEGEMALPVPIQGDKALVDYAINRKLQKALDHPETKYIVMCDEFTRGTVPVISEFMTILNERQLQGVKFSDNIRFIAAMNPSQSMRDFHDTDYVASEMDDAHANRFTFIHMDADVNDWLEWAKAEGDIHTLVTEFLESSNNKLHFYEKENDGIRMRTPRSWDFLSSQLKDAEEQDLLTDFKFMYGVIGDQIGYDIVHEFTNFMQDRLKAIEFEEVFCNKKLTKDQLTKFKEYDYNKQKTILDAFVDRLVLEKDNLESVVTQPGMDNFSTLLMLIDEIDLRYGITMSMASKLYISYKDTTLIEAFYDENTKASRELVQFITEQQEKLNLIKSKTTESES